MNEDARVEAIRELRLALHDLKVVDSRLRGGDAGNLTWRNVVSAQMYARKALQLLDSEQSGDDKRFRPPEGDRPRPTRQGLAEMAKIEAARCFHGTAMRSESNLHPIIDLFSWSVEKADGRWCSAFVYYCCISAGFEIPVKPIPSSPDGHNLASCFAWEEWAISDSDVAYYQPDAAGFTPGAGDIILFDKVWEGKDNDHMGVVVESRDRSLIVAEGNFNNISGLIERKIVDSHIRAYIRLPDNYMYQPV
jgi:CHAP domain